MFPVARTMRITLYVGLQSGLNPCNNDSPSSKRYLEQLLRPFIERISPRMLFVSPVVVTYGSEVLLNVEINFSGCCPDGTENLLSMALEENIQKHLTYVSDNYR